MSADLAPGDYLVFQLESGFGLLRVLAIDHMKEETIWHLLVYEELFPDVESAESRIARSEQLNPRVPHIAITNRAFERTSAARLCNQPLSEDELDAYREWQIKDGSVSDRSVLLMIGLR